VLLSRSFSSAFPLLLDDGQMASPSEQLSSDSFYDFSVSSRISLVCFAIISPHGNSLLLLSFSGGVWCPGTIVHS